MTIAATPDTPPARVAVAWLVHAFTASGAVIGALALLSVSAGDLSRAAILMLLALAIDAVDGTLARKAGVASILPGMDGRRLDDIVDYLNYAIVPAVFLVAAGSLTSVWWAALPILASAYGFSQTEAKTEDDFFLGFPSYWNVIAIYLWQLDIGPGLGTSIIVVFAALVFVPIKYLYPSKMRTWRKTTLGLSALWLVVMSAAIAWPGAMRAAIVVPLSLAYPVYYLAASFWLGGIHRKPA